MVILLWCRPVASRASQKLANEQSAWKEPLVTSLAIFEVALKLMLNNICLRSTASSTLVENFY